MAPPNFKKDSHQHNIVIVGNFNPSIFQPSWFASKGLIGPSEAESCKELLLHSEIARMDFDWMSLEVLADKFQIKSTQEAYFQPLLDFVIGVFTILQETPVKAFGINNALHYRVKDRATRDQFAHYLAPTQPWKDVLTDPLLVKLEVLEEKKNDSIMGYYRVAVEPSEIIKYEGVKFSTNDHFQHAETQRQFTTAELLKHLGSAWSESNKRAERSAEVLWSKFQAS